MALPSLNGIKKNAVIISIIVLACFVAVIGRMAWWQIIKGEELSKKYFADIVVGDNIIIELKAISSLTQADSSQLINYMKATGIKLGLLINFGNRRKLEWERRVFTNSTYQKKRKHT